MPPCDVDNSEQQIEYASVKFLLKQVYSAHINKVKSLEDELRAVKDELENAKKELNDNKANCKQCEELQNAFSACKFALMEQTRWFENLGEKFSHKDESSKSKMANSCKSNDGTPNISELSKHELFTKSVESNINVSGQFKNIKFEDISSQLFSPSELQTLCSSSEKAVTVPSQDKGMSIKAPNICSQVLPCVKTDRSRLSLDAETFNSESFVLVPDSVDTFADGNAGHDIIDISSPKVSVSKLNEITSVISDEIGSKTISACDTRRSISKIKPEFGKKRQLSDSSDGEIRISKHNKSKNNYVLSDKIELTNNHNKKNNTAATSDVEIVEASQNRVDLLLFAEKKVFSKPNSLKKSPEPHSSQSKAVKKINHMKALDIRICSSNGNIAVVEVGGKSKKTDEICLNEKAIQNINSANNNSASLVTTLSKKTSPIRNFVPEEILSDNDDFQSSVTNSSYPNDTSVSKTCDKKKPLKKSAKALKFSSKYKMTLDSPSLNYKKPNYKQTKLSTDIFKLKSSQESAPQNRNEANKQTIPLVHEVFTKSKTASCMDFDATCIPENFKYVASPNGNVLGDIGNICRSPEENTKNINEELVPEKSYKETVSQDLLVDAYSFRENSPDVLSIEGKSDEDDIDFEDLQINRKRNTDSFDRIPVPDVPNYKYKEETIRNRVQRKQLVAFECKECEKYFSELELTDEEKQERLKHCSRHRAKFLPPPTPDHFWELEFPDTQECKVRGYQAETQKVQLKSRRRRPLT